MCEHCYVTGGSQGLGRSLALQLAKQGADITIVARTVSKLEATLKELEVSHQLSSQMNN